MKIKDAFKLRHLTWRNMNFGDQNPVIYISNDNNDDRRNGSIEIESKIPLQRRQKNVRSSNLDTFKIIDICKSGRDSIEKVQQTRIHGILSIH
jgi:hypothetical protein